MTLLVVLTAGHANDDPGATAAGTSESAIAVEMRNMVAGLLRSRGVTVETDGEGALNQPLSKAIQMISGKVLAVELHCNSSTNASAKGVECIALPNRKQFAQRLAAAIAGTFTIPVRGDCGYITQEQSARGKLWFVNRGGVIAELFFLSNVSERNLYQTRKGVLARNIADTIYAEVSNAR